MRVSTFNVNSLRSRLPILQRWLPHSGVDVLALQETKVQDEDFPLADVQALGYRAVFRGEKSYNGVALLSRSRPDEVVYGFDDGLSPIWDTRMMMARWGDLWILNTYVPQGKEITHPDYEAKKDFLRRTAALVRRHKDEKLLWLGDLNVAPTELDVTNPANKKNHVCFVKELRDLFAQLCAPLVTDMLRVFHPDEALYSFFDYRVKNALQRGIGWRIDHMLSTAPLTPLCTDCRIDTDPRGWEKPSDHTPMLADFNN